MSDKEEKRIEDILHVLGNLTDRLEAMSNQMGQRFEKMDQRLSVMDQQFEKMDQRFREQEIYELKSLTALQATNTRVDAVWAHVTEANVGASVEAVAALEERVERLEAKFG